MSKKKLLILLCAIVLICVTGFTALTVFAESGGKERLGRNLTEEEKAELKENFKARKEELKKKFNDFKEKWNSLPEEKKAEIYEIKDKISELLKELAEKYKENGLIDEETAEKIKNRITEKSEEFKKNGAISFFGKGHGKFFRKWAFRCPDKKS